MNRQRQVIREEVRRQVHAAAQARQRAGAFVNRRERVAWEAAERKAVRRRLEKRRAVQAEERSG